jgi:hypothetical protein
VVATDPLERSRVKDRVLVILAWLPVALPLAWGIWQTVKKAAVLFRVG